MPVPWAYFDASVLLNPLHLASALAFQAMSGIRIPLITADIRQRDAASRLDLTVMWIGSA